MPTISSFFGIAIRMYYDDHAPPHFHALYGEHSAVFDIQTLIMIEDMPKIIRVRAMPNWQLEVEFDDGTVGTISLADRLFGPMFEPLRDPEFFSQVQLDGFESICWPDGVDLAPDAIHRALVAENQRAAKTP